MARCVTPRCRKAVLPSGKSPYCNRCKARRFKEAHPLKYAFNKLRYRARERGHHFNLSYFQFADLAHKSGWATGRGKTAESLSFDRIDEARGYEVENLQVLTLSENSAKAARFRYVKLPPALRAELEAARATQDPF
jgi:hypothetical protein